MKRLYRSLVWKMFPHAKLNLKTPNKRYEIPLRHRGDFAALNEIFVMDVYKDFLPYLKDVTSWIDLGCNCGYFTLKMFDSIELSKGTRALMIDGNNSCLKSAKEMAAINGFTGVHVCHALMGRSGEEVTFYESKSSLRSSLFKPGSKEKEISMRTTSLADIFLKNGVQWDLIKIDIEGAEKIIFEEQGNELKHFSYILVEWHAPYWSGKQMKEWIEKGKFKLLMARPQTLGNDFQGDPFEDRCGMVLLSKNKI